MLYCINGGFKNDIFSRNVRQYYFNYNYTKKSIAIIKKAMKLKYTSTVDYQLKMLSHLHFLNLKYDACVYIQF